MKTIEDLNAELDEAIERSDLEAMDRIYADLERLEADGTVPDEPAKTDVAAAKTDPVEDEDGGSSTAADADGQGNKGDDRLVPLKEAKVARQEAARLREENEALLKQLQEREAPTDLLEQLERSQRLQALLAKQVEDNGLKPAQLPEEMKIDIPALMERVKKTGEYGEDLGEAFTSLAETVATLAAQNEFYAKSIKANQARYQAEDKPSDPATEDPAQIVENTPDLKRWFGNQESWEVVQAADKYLAAQPAFKNKPLSARVPRLVEMVRADLGEKPASAPRYPIDVDKAIADGKKQPLSLTDIGGAHVDSEASLLERSANMTDAELLAEYAKGYASGRSVDELIDQNLGIM